MSKNVTSQSLDHIGLIAGICLDLNLAQLANALIGRRNEHAKVTVGDAIVALILNGFGFANRSLYMTSRFFEGKPVERLLGKDISASDLNDDTLGRALDVIADFGPEKLLASLAFEIGGKRNLLGKSVHLDTTSVSVHGEYDVPDQDGVIKINRGYSKDHRQDLKQFIVSLTVTGPASLPIWSETLSGNTSDKTSFHETIDRVHSFQKGLTTTKEFLWVADSALYSKDKLLASPSLRWLTRVPETIKECRELVEMDSSVIPWRDAGNGYKIHSVPSTFGDMEQRWLLVFSEKAFEREKATFEKNLDATEEELLRDLWHLENKIFVTKDAAKAELALLQEKYKLYAITASTEPVHKYEGKGRPPLGAKKKTIGYQLAVSDAHFLSEKAELILNKKGRFVLGTNELDCNLLSDEGMLTEYKSQQDVERGFRFLKNDEFGVSDIFLKNPRRIMALMAVMTLCLMVYNIAQYELREKLAEQKETIPNQVGKPTTSPTLRSIFLNLQDIALVHIGDSQPVVTNITELREKILRLFPPAVQQIYGLEERTTLRKPNKKKLE